MSRETAELRFEASQAERKWREHKQACPVCARAYRARKYDDICEQGKQVRQAFGAAERALIQSRKLDKLPSPDQMPLF